MKTKHISNNVNLENYTPRVLALCLLATLLLLALTGCKKESSNTSSNVRPDLSGVYSLVSIDDKAVPCEISHEGTPMAVKSGTFTIANDGHCGSRMIFSVGSRKDMDLERKASYASVGAELTMQWEGAGMTMGSVHDNTFTMTNEGMVFSYRK